MGIPILPPRPVPHAAGVIEPRCLSRRSRQESSCRLADSCGAPRCASVPSRPLPGKAVTASTISPGRQVFSSHGSSGPQGRKIPKPPLQEPLTGTPSAGRTGHALGEWDVFAFAAAGFLADAFVDLDAVAAGTTERAGWTLAVGIAAPTVPDSRPARAGARDSII